MISILIGSIPVAFHTYIVLKKPPNREELQNHSRSVSVGVLLASRQPLFGGYSGVIENFEC
jgi:hypothetical protein